MCLQTFDVNYEEHQRAEVKSRKSYRASASCPSSITMQQQPAPYRGGRKKESPPPMMTEEQRKKWEKEREKKDAHNNSMLNECHCKDKKSTALDFSIFTPE